jgi:hypothetical protein
MKHGILHLFKKILGRINGYYRNINHWIRNRGFYIMPVSCYQIKDSENEELFTFLFIGWDQKLCNYWLTRFSGENEIRPERKNIALWNIPEFLKKNKDKFDIVIIETTKKALPGKYPGSFLLPRWMEMELDIESFIKKASSKDIKRSIKRNSLEYEIRTGINAFDLFYHTMYKPYIEKRHGLSADLPNYKHFHNKWFNTKWALFFIIRENEPVAGAFIGYKQGRYRLNFLGIKDGSEEIMKMGAVRALYYFFMLFYYEKGIKSLLAGVSMPVVLDGVTQSKMRIGAQPYLEDLDKRSKNYFIPVNINASTIKVLKLNPLYYFSGGTLNIALFLSAEDYQSKEDFFKFFNRLETINVKMTRIYFFDKPEKIIQWISEENISGIEFISYNGKSKLPSEKFTNPSWELK